jgi:hypothetical protein
MLLYLRSSAFICGSMPATARMAVLRSGLTAGRGCALPMIVPRQADVVLVRNRRWTQMAVVPMVTVVPVARVLRSIVLPWRRLLVWVRRQESVVGPRRL